GGRFAVTYVDFNGTDNDIKYTIVEANGTVGTPRLANATATGSQSAGRAAALADGNFVIVWVDENSHISARVFSGTNGNPIANEFGLTTRTGWEGVPDVSGLGGGNFVACWRDPANSNDVVARRGTSAGGTGAEFSVATGANNQNSPRVTGFSDGSFVVCWSE